MKRLTAAVIAAIMLALLCTGCLFPDSLVTSVKYASKFSGYWESEDRASLRVGKDDDTIGYIEYTMDPDDVMSDHHIGDWDMKNTTLIIRWSLSAPFIQPDSEKDESTEITYTFARFLDDSVIEQGKDAIQNGFDHSKGEHYWYASDQYLCLDNRVFTRVKR